MEGSNEESEARKLFQQRYGTEAIAGVEMVVVKISASGAAVYWRREELVARRRRS
jgi:hypothetical protein